MNFSFIPLPFRKYIRSFILSTLLTLLIFSLLSIIFSFFPPHEKVLSSLISAAPFIPCFLASFFSGLQSEKNGAFSGILSSLFFLVILIFIGMIFFKSPVSPSSLLKTFLLSSLCGMCGGVLGINFK